jgi:hypothetical protein
VVAGINVATTAEVALPELIYHRVLHALVVSLLSTVTSVQKRDPQPANAATPAVQVLVEHGIPVPAQVIANADKMVGKRMDHRGVVHSVAPMVASGIPVMDSAILVAEHI